MSIWKISFGAQYPQKLTDSLFNEPKRHKRHQRHYDAVRICSFEQKKHNSSQQLFYKKKKTNDEVRPSFVCCKFNATHHARSLQWSSSTFHDLSASTSWWSCSSFSFRKTTCRQQTFVLFLEKTVTFLSSCCGCSQRSMSTTFRYFAFLYQKKDEVKSKFL